MTNTIHRPFSVSYYPTDKDHTYIEHTAPDGKIQGAEFLWSGRDLEKLGREMACPDYYSYQFLASKKVLDVCCGKGWLVDDLNNSHDKSLKIQAVGVDIKIDSNIAKQASLLQSDALNLAFKNRCFDVVFCSFGLFTYRKVSQKQREAALGEIARVIKPNGTIILGPIYTKVLPSIRQAAAEHGLILQGPPRQARDGFMPRRQVLVFKKVAS